MRDKHPNLHTLCLDCNLGKSDKEHAQHSLFEQEATTPRPDEVK